MKKNLILVLLIVMNTIVYSQDFWVKTNGPYGANINSIFIDNNTNNIFLATKSDGVYISTDDGNSWESTNDGVLKSRTWVNDILLDNRILYVATDSLGILKKLPYQNWKAINSGMGGFLFFKTIIKLGGKTFIAGSNGKAIFKTTNSGKNWFNLNTGLKTDEVVNCLFNLGNNVLLLGSNNSIFLSTNSGTSWVNKKDNIGNVNKIIKVSDKIFIASDSGIFMSADSGENWVEVNTGINDISPVLSITADETNLFIVVKNKGVFKTNIEQINWLPIDNGLHTLKLKTIEINKNKKELIAGSNCSFYKFNKEKNQWLSNNLGLGLRTINSIINYDNKGTIVAGTDLGVYQSNNNGYNWFNINQGFGDILDVNCIKKINDSLFFAGTQGGGLYYSNLETPWQKVNEPDFTSTIVNTLNIDSSGFIYAGTTENGIFKSEDNGHNWYQIFGNEINNTNITSMVISTGNTIFLGTKRKGLFKKIENGEWRNLDNIGYAITEISTLNISTDSTNNIILYAGTNLGLKKSLDGGNSWFDANGKYPENLPGKIEAMFSDTKGVSYCGLKNISGVYSSTDGGEKWIRILDRSGIMNYKMKSFNLSSIGFLYAGSQNGGCYRSFKKIIGDNKEPAPPKLTLIGDSSFCKGGFAIIDAGDGYISYNWSNGRTTRYDTVSITASYWVKVKDLLQIELISDTINIKVYDIPPKPNIIFNDKKFICTSNAASYQWYFNNDIIAGANDKEYIPILNGWYKCEIASEFNCKNMSDSLEYKKSISSVDEYSRKNTISVYPNPNSGTFVLKLNNIKYNNAKIFITNLLGMNITYYHSNHINKNNSKINIESHLRPGIYILRVEVQYSTFYKKLIIR